ncbi:MAG TPA: hypothetical protein VN851_09240, partial [Thermoanaerobaculia bacterium]|nr:hypothetical protein [Thermoanaerobaculia bacterium]
TPPLTDPAGWEDHASLRFTLLSHFTKPGDATALERVGAMLYDFALEMAPSWPAAGQPTMHLALTAGASDLRYLVGYLTDAGSLILEEGLAAKEAPLALKAIRHAEAIAEIAAQMERDLED